MLFFSLQQMGKGYLNMQRREKVNVRFERSNVREQRNSTYRSQEATAALRIGVAIDFMPNQEPQYDSAVGLFLVQSFVLNQNESSALAMKGEVGVAPQSHSLCLQSPSRHLVRVTSCGDGQFLK